MRPEPSDETECLEAEPPESGRFPRLLLLPPGHPANDATSREMLEARVTARDRRTIALLVDSFAAARR